MPRILCHSVKQNAQLFKIVPTKNNISDEFVLYLEKCLICSSPVLEIVRFDIWGELLSPVRLKAKNIPEFLDSMSVIWKPKKIMDFGACRSRFALGYNHHGVKKICSQSVSNLQLGRVETDPYLDLVGFLRKSF